MRLLVSVLGKDSYSEALLGDLHEEWVVQAEQNPRLATLWYWAESLRLVFRHFASQHASGGANALTPPPTGGRVGAAIRSDVAMAYRTLRRSPRFTVVAILTLSLGVTATATVFAFFDAGLLKPLAYDGADRLVVVWELNQNGERGYASPPLLHEWRNGSTAFSHFAAVTGFRGSMILSDGNLTERVRARFVSASYFDMLGTPAAFGRTFHLDEDQVGRDGVAVLTHRFWRTRFAADSGIVGRELRMNNRGYLVVGVLPDEPVFDRDVPDLWLPLSFSVADMRPSNQFFTVLARVRDGVSLTQAEQDLRSVAAAMDVAGRTYHRGWTVQLQPLREYVVPEQLRRAMRLLLASVGVLLIIACTNVAGMHLAFGAAREGQLAIRAALGATRWRLAQQALAESVIIGVIGGAAGAGLAAGVVRVVERTMPRASLPTEMVLGLDGRVVVVTITICFLTGLLFGLLPAWRAGRPHHRLATHHTRRGAPMRGRRLSALGALLVAEVTLASALLVWASLLASGFARLLRIDPGIRVDDVLTWQTELDPGRYDAPGRLLAYHQETLERLRGLPGVDAVAITNALPLSGATANNSFHIVGQVTDSATPTDNAGLRIVSPGYFATLGMRLVSGRLLTEGDWVGGPPVAVINESMHVRSWQGRNAIGDRVLLDGPGLDDVPFEIVGVVADVRHAGLDVPASQEIYVLYSDLPRQSAGRGRSMTYVLQSRTNLTSLVPAVRSVIAAVDRYQPIHNIRSMREVYAESVASPRFRLVVLGTFAVVALALMSAGVYGTISWGVAQRLREIGVRLAIGATPREVVRMVVLQGGVLCAIGIFAGLVIAAAAARVVTTMLPGFIPWDPVAFATAAALVLAVGLVASYAPARRAASVDPVAVIREDTV